MTVQVIRNHTEKKEIAVESAGIATNQNPLAEAKVPEAQKTEIQKEAGQTEIFKKAAGLNNVPVSEVELEQVRAVGREYRELLATFRSAGFDIKPERGLIDLPSRTANPLYEMEVLGPGANQWSAYDSAHPREILMFKYGANLHMDPNLAAQGKVVEFPIYGLHTEKTESGDKHVKIFNYLDTDRPLVYSAVLSKSQSLEPTSDTANDIRKALHKGLQKTEGRLQELIAEPSATLAQPAVTIDYKRKTDSATQAVLAKLSNLANPPTFKAVPEGFASDQYFQAGILGKPFQVSLSPEMLKNTGAHPIVIKGDMHGLEFEDTRKFTIDREAGTVNGRKYRDKETSGSGTETFYVDSRDSFGNHVFETYEQRKNGDQRRMIFLDLPTPRAERGASLDSRSPVPVNFDLTPQGYGRVVDYLYVVPEATLTNAGPYAVSSNMDAATALSLLQGKSSALSSGTARIEELFGLKPGEAVQNIRLINSDNPNAFFQRRNPGSTVILDELLKTATPESAQNVAQHEAVHLLDSRYDWKLSRGALAKLFETTSAETFEQINEKSFYNFDGPAGHAEDNPRELTASLINSLLAPEWGNKVRSFSKEVRQQYCELVKALQTDLQVIKELDAKAPIHDLLMQRMATLDAQ